MRSLQAKSFVCSWTRSEGFVSAPSRTQGPSWCRHPQNKCKSWTRNVFEYPAGRKAIPSIVCRWGGWAFFGDLAKRHFHQYEAVQLQTKDCDIWSAISFDNNFIISNHHMEIELQKAAGAQTQDLLRRGVLVGKYKGSLFPFYRSWFYDLGAAP